MLAMCLILLAGCTSNPIGSWENINEEIVEKEVWWDMEAENEIEEIEEEDEIIDGQWWSLMAFNWKEVDWNYRMVIKDDQDISVKFCNGIWWTVNFDWWDEWIISASLIQTEMACEWESMNLENAFKIDGATYSIMADEDWWSTMIITTTNWDKFYWRAIMD